MVSFAKYTIIDWIAFIQVLLIWFYMAYRSGQWIVSVACSNGWRWWNRKNKKALALASLYRLCNDYWNKRIMFREYDRLIITKGYPKRDDSSRRIDVPYEGYEIKTITHPHFGDKPVKVFAIKVNIDG
ncbi:hypothetical protein DS975_25800 [Escherichia coli]|nr:hypothetical protein DS975_25800 [Escherichia coli]